MNLTLHHDDRYLVPITKEAMPVNIRMNGKAASFVLFPLSIAGGICSE